MVKKRKIMSATMKTSESYFLRGEEGGRAIFLEGDIFPWEEWGDFFLGSIFPGIVCTCFKRSISVSLVTDFL